jgi:multiple sugar transport system permease protein
LSREVVRAQSVEKGEPSEGGSSPSAASLPGDAPHLAARLRGKGRRSPTRQEAPSGRWLSTDRALAYLFILPTALLVIGLAVYPFVQAAFDSLFRIDLVTRAGSFVGLANYAKLVADPALGQAFTRTGLWVVANLVIQVVLGLAIALLLDLPLRGRTIARGLVLFPYMVPAVVAALTFRALTNDVTGVVNYALISVGLVQEPVEWLSSPDLALWTVILVNCWKYTPFMVIVLLARLQSVPPSLREAARIDGAGAWGVFANVTLPWVLPVLLAAMLLRTIWLANDFDLIYLLAFGGPLGATTTVPIAIRGVAFGDQNVGLASALAIVAALFLIVGAGVYSYLYRRSERSDE